MNTPITTLISGRRTTPSALRRWRDSLALSFRAFEPALLLFLAARAVGVSLILLLGPGSAASSLRRLAVHWDASWYLGIAEHGYDHAIRPGVPGVSWASTNLAFFPAYPALIRGVHTVLPFLTWGTAGLLTSSLCAVGAAWGIFAATSLHYGEKVGTLTTLLWGVAPVAALEMAGYSESAFTMFAAWALYCALARRWLAAGVLSVLAGLTRPSGVAVAAAVICAAALEIWTSRREHRDGPALWRPLTAIVIAPLGWLGFVVWTGVRLHSWDAYFKIQSLWHSRFDFGTTTAHDMRVLFTSTAPVGLYYPVVAAVLIAAAVLFVTSVAQRQPPAFVVYTCVTMLIAYGDSAYFSSRARFLLPTFPLLIPLAAGLVRLRTRAALYAVLAACTITSGLYGAYVTLYADHAP